MLTQNEQLKTQRHDDLYPIVRPERPPEITAAPYPKRRVTDKGKQAPGPSVTKRVTTRSHIEEINPTPMPQENSQRYQQSQMHHTEMDTDLPIENRDKPKKPRAKRTPPEIKYDIVSDVLKQKADIEIGDLITVAPSLRRKLVNECRPKRKKPEVQQTEQTMALIEDDEFNTTAAYTHVFIGDKKIKALVDCGAAKTCMSKALADALQLEIDDSSECVFTLGNGTKQPTLGLVYDVPIEVKENMVIPCVIEVLPSCPSHLILGNNWLNRAKAKIDFNSRTLKVHYKKQKAELEIQFIRKNVALPKMQIYQQTYKHPISLTNNSPAKQVRFDISDSEEDTSSDEDEESESEEEDVEVEEEEEQPLMVLESDKREEVTITSFKETHIIQAPKNGITIPANSSMTLTMDKPEKGSNDWVYLFDTIHPKLSSAEGYFDPCSSLVVNKRTIEIRFFNRTNAKIVIQPEEELGVLDKYNLQQDVVVSAYSIQPDPELCLFEISNKENDRSKEENILEPALFDKMEIGDLPLNIRKKLRTLLSRYKHIFDWDNSTMGRTDLIQHKIIIDKDAMPISHRPYRLSPIEAEYLKKELEKYCKLGIISPSNSPWAAPVILVKKKNGEYRMVIDYRKLNAITKKDAYPLPRIDDLLDTLGKAKVFSALDMRAGFHQVPLEESSKELTAFTTKFGTYHYNMLPMGLVNSPATFQRLIDLCFRPLISKCLVAYIDDLNVYSDNEHEHLHHLELVFQCIEAANLILNPEKCFFFKNHLKFLGYIVTKDGIHTDPDKIKKIIEYPRPKSITQVRAFLGIASYYRRFIKDFAAIARPLHDQTKTKKKIPWTQATTNSFETLKKKLTTAPVLARPDFNKEFILVTDASKLGLGCVLTQLDEEGKEHPIVFASRGLKPNEVNYAPTKLECLAVVWAVKLFRPYLLGRKFTIITDHSALTELLKTPNPTGIIARWIVILTEYEFIIKYRPGRVNESADFLSRLGY